MDVPGRQESIFSKEHSVFLILMTVSRDLGAVSLPPPIFQTNQPSDRLLQAANHLERCGTRALKLNIPSNNHCLFQANQQKVK